MWMVAFTTKDKSRYLKIYIYEKLNINYFIFIFNRFKVSFSADFSQQLIENGSFPLSSDQISAVC